MLINLLHIVFVTSSELSCGNDPESNPVPDVLKLPDMSVPNAHFHKSSAAFPFGNFIPNEDPTCHNKFFAIPDVKSSSLLFTSVNPFTYVQTTS